MRMNKMARAHAATPVATEVFMKAIKRIVSALVFLALCISLLCACGGEDVSVAESGSGTVSSTDNRKFSYGPADYGEFPYKDKKLDANDEIVILCVETARHTYGEQQFAYDPEKDSNAINHAVGMRNDMLREQYGISFDVIPVKSPCEASVSAIQSGTAEYDIICDSVDRLAVGALNDLYSSLDGKMDFSHPWWDSEANEMLSLGNRHFFLTGDAILTDDDNTYLTLFNKDIYAKNADLSAHGDIYQIVRDGDFTIDLYYEMCKQVSHTDENGSWGFNATYGNLSHSYGATVMMNGCNVATVGKDENGDLHINVLEARAVNAFQKVYDIMSDKQNTQRAELIIGQSPNNKSTYGFAELAEMFIEGRGLFYNTTSSSISSLKGKQMGFDFGVLPIPKYDTAQENYCNTVNRYHSSAIAIPKTVTGSRFDDVVFALQALGFYNSDVIRAYYQTTLQLQAVTTDNDADMLDIVYNNRFYDIGAIYGWGTGSQTLINLYGAVINDSTNTLVSRWEAMQSAVEDSMQKTIDAYAGIS